LRYLAILLASIGLAACDENGATGPGGPGAPGGFSRGPTYVLTEPATLREIRDQVEAIGTARANESLRRSPIR
jgi:hypothetical protein